MLRAKLAFLLLFVIVAMVSVSLLLTDRIATDLVTEAEEQLKSSNEVVRLANNIGDYSVMTEAADAVSVPEINAGIVCPTTEEALAEARREVTPPTEDGAPPVEPVAPRTTCTTTQHIAVLDALKAWNRARGDLRADNELRYLSDRDSGYAIPHEPDLLIAADADGVVVARVGFDKDDWFGASRANMQEFAVVSRSELGTVQNDLIVWREHESAAPTLAQVGVAPIIVDGAFAGSILVGYFLTDDSADEAGQLLFGVDVAYFFRAGGSDVAFAGTTYASRPDFLSGMESAEFVQRSGGGEETISFAEVALTRGGTVYDFEHDGKRYMVMSTALSKSTDGTEVQSGFVVITSASQAVAPLSRLSMITPALGFGLLFIGVFGILIAIREFMMPVEEISKGVQEVIAGNRDYMWEVDEKNHLSDLAHSLNIMSARLQGKRDPDADDVEGAEDWAAMAGQPAAQPADGGAKKGIAGLGNLRGRQAEESGTSDEAEEE